MTPEIKNHVFAKVTEMIESCCENEKCVCPDDRLTDDVPWFEDGPNSDNEFERRWDDGEGR